MSYPPSDLELFAINTRREFFMSRLPIAVSLLPLINAPPTVPVDYSNLVEVL